VVAGDQYHVPPRSRSGRAVERHPVGMVIWGSRDVPGGAGQGGRGTDRDPKSDVHGASVPVVVECVAPGAPCDYARREGFVPGASYSGDVTP
jgi:hypothetical protein